MDKPEIIKWVAKHNDEYPLGIEKEKVLGDKFRATKTLTKDDLRQVVEWKFDRLEGRKNLILKFIEQNSDEVIQQTGNLVFNLTICDDLLRIRSLDDLEGVGPAISSVILTFYHPKNYGIIDIHVERQTCCLFVV
jgi:uncharacterized protein (UPF0335 family)